MWAELDAINSILPEEQIQRIKVNLTDRNIYPKAKTDEAKKERILSQHLMNLKNYKGPQVIPLMPKSIQ